jgi:hypothetical protein
MPKVDERFIDPNTYPNKDRLTNQLLEMLAIAALKYNGGVFEYEPKDDALLVGTTNHFTGDDKKQVFKVETRKGN